jgi:hypothetical protein
LDTEPPIFREAEELLQADEWLNTIEQKFYVLKVADDMKTEYASQQLQGHVGIWWCHHRNTLPENMEFGISSRKHFGDITFLLVSWQSSTPSL